MTNWDDIRAVYRHGEEYDHYWMSELRNVYRQSTHEPIILNEGTPYEEPFGVSLALLWAERLARA